MRSIHAALVCLSACVGGLAQTVRAPAYTETGIIDFATAKSGVLTQNSLAVVHGKDLSYVTRARLATDLQGGRYPSALPEANVSVKVRGVAAPVEFASPNLVIFVVPGQAAPGKADVQVVRQGVAGPRVPIELRAEAPLPYPAEEGCLLARHAASGEWVETASPARPGEDVLIYAGGLGRIVPPLRELQAPLAPAPLEKGAALRVLVDGIELDRSAITYAGSLPGFAGVYEIRLRLPWAIVEDPQLLLLLDGQPAPVSLKLPLRYPPPQPDSPLLR